MIKSNSFFETLSSDQISSTQIKTICGGAMLISGGVIYLDQSLKWGWLTVMAIGLLGILFLYIGIRYHKMVLILPGGLIIGFGLGLNHLLSTFDTLPAFLRLGYTFGFIAIGWMIAFLGILIGIRRKLWWINICSFTFCAISVSFYFGPTQFLFWIMSISIAIGLGLFLWGLSSKYIGLLIPGSLLLTIGPGIYLAWNSTIIENGLSQTGLMILWFSLGWFILTVFSRLIYSKFLWWPLIPGGILAVVGWGLTIGGNPSSAILFIRSSGSVGLIIFGLYLLFMKMGIHK